MGRVKSPATRVNTPHKPSSNIGSKLVKPPKLYPARNQSSRHQSSRHQSSRHKSSRHKSSRHKSSRRQSPCRQSPRRQSPRRQSPRRQSPRRQSPRRQSPRRQSPRRQSAYHQSARYQSSRHKAPLERARSKSFSASIGRQQKPKRSKAQRRNGEGPALNRETEPAVGVKNETGDNQNTEEEWEDEREGKDSPFSNTMNSGGPKTQSIGELISDPNNILKLPVTKVIVDKHTDAIIREQMIGVIPDGQLTKQRLNRLISDGIDKCLSIWHVAYSNTHSNIIFWDRVGSSGGWLRHLGSSISRQFFLKLCVLYHNGSRRKPNNKMMIQVAKLYNTFVSENTVELDAYIEKHSHLPETSSMALDPTGKGKENKIKSQGSRRSVKLHNGDIFSGTSTADPKMPAVLGQLVHIASFGAAERQKEQEQRDRNMKKLTEELEKAESAGSRST